MTYSTSLRNSRILSCPGSRWFVLLILLADPRDDVVDTWLPGSTTVSFFLHHKLPRIMENGTFPNLIGYPSKMTKIFSSNIHNVSQVGSKHFFAHLLLLLPNSPCIKDTKQHGRCFNGCPWTKNQTRCGEMQPGKTQWESGFSRLPAGFIQDVVNGATE